MEKRRKSATDLVAGLLNVGADVCGNLLELGVGAGRRLLQQAESANQGSRHNVMANIKVVQRTRCLGAVQSVQR